MQTSQITLNYTCDSAEHADTITAEQPLTEVVIAGGLVCPECDEDMYLSGEVTVKTTAVEAWLDVTRDPQLSTYWARRGGRTAFIADYNAAEH